MDSVSDEALMAQNPNRHLSPEPPKYGPTLSIIVIVMLLLLLGAYFGLVRLKERRAATQQIPYIPGSSTSSVQ